MPEQIRIIKRNGEAEPLNISKINKVVAYSCAGLDGVSASEIIKQASLHFTDGMSTERIQEILIKAANELVTKETPNYTIPAARLNLYDVRKRVFHDHAVPTVQEHVQNLVEKGIYHETLLQYTNEDFERFEQAIDHDRDDNFSTAAVGQLTDKYLLRDRTKGSRSFYETPQFMYMAIAMTLFSEYPRSEKRTQDIIDFYHGASTFKFSLPTPIMGGARTPTRQFSSCVLINCGDTLDSINATATAITNYVSKKAGIGVAHGSIRAEGAAIRKGEMVHTGVVPFLKYHVGALKSCSQGGLRGGSATFYYPWWHLQIEDILVLKNNKGTYENRERRVDYGINFNRKIFQEFLKGGDVYLFSPEEVVGLEEAFYSGDNDKFEETYDWCVGRAKRGEIRFKKIPASMLIHEFVEQRSETGRIYAKFSDNVNKQSPFDQNKHPIHSSNLCAEVALPTKPLHSEHDENGRIALCTLSSFNMLEFPDAVGDAVQRQALFNSAKTIVRALDGLLQYQDYPMIQAKLSTDEFRSLGVGVVNLASFLAYHGAKYGSPEANKRLNEWFELFTLALTTASVELAEEIGPCSKWQETCYGQGIFPHQQHPSSIFELDGVAPEKLYEREWDELSQRILKSGIRNATLSAIAPTESSSQVLNATNGVEMPTGPIAIKGSKSGNFKQPVPLPADKYQYVWDQKDCQPYLHTMAIIQRWIDQSISTNTFYAPELWGGTIPRDVIIGHIIEFYSLGGKTLYYSKMPDGATDTDEDETELPSNNEDEDCDSCKV